MEKSRQSFTIAAPIYSSPRFLNSLFQIAGVAASLSLLKRDAEAARLITATDRIGRELGILEVRGIASVKAELEELERRLGPDEWERYRAASADLSFEDLIEEARALSTSELRR